LTLNLPAIVAASVLILWRKKKSKFNLILFNQPCYHQFEWGTRKLFKGHVIGNEDIQEFK
jgi:hypothetical protein